MNETRMSMEGRTGGVPWSRGLGMAAAWLLVSLPSLAQGFFTQTSATGLGLAIPDNSSVGVAHELSFSGVGGLVTHVELTLNIVSRDGGPMFNGDIFATLTHGTGYSVLLNRAGRREGFESGYGDNGFVIRLSDTGAADVHTYRLTLNGSHFVPISNLTPGTPLTGTWQPDGRTADPGVVGVDSPRTAGLSEFNGLNPNGLWTLFVADLGTGGTARLEGWSLELSSVPEPVHGALAIGALLLLGGAVRRYNSPRFSKA